MLASNSRTRIVFKPEIHKDGVRGYIVRQRAGLSGNWMNANEVNFATIPPDCGVRIELDTEATGKLYEGLCRLHKLQEHGIESGRREYVVAESESVVIVDDLRRAANIRELLDQGYSEEIWKELSEQNPDLAARLAAAKIQLDRTAAIRKFEASLTSHSDDEGYWEHFFGSHPWMLQSAFSVAVFKLNDETYLGGKRAVGRQGKGGVATDFLFADETTKSFAVVEIKTPDARLVGGQYRGAKREIGYANEVYAMHTDLSGGIVQVRNQVAVAVEDFQLVLRRTYEDILNAVHPIGVLVIGSTASMSPRQKDSFNQFRHALHSLTISTFDEVLSRLKRLFGVDEGDLEPASHIEEDDVPSPDEEMHEPGDWYEDFPEEALP